MLTSSKIHAVLRHTLSGSLFCLTALAFGCPSVRAASQATDDAGNYDTSGTVATGFTSGSNRGSGFMPYLLTFTSNSGAFVAQNNPDSQISSNSSGGTPQVFDMYGFSGGNSAVTRPFTGALSVGQSFAVSIDSRGVDNGTSVGVSLTDAGGNARFTFDFLGGTNQLRVTDASGTRAIGSNLNFSVLGDGIRMVFTLSGVNSYSVTATGITQSTKSDTTTGTLAGTAGSGIDRATIFDNNAGSDHDLFFNNLAVTGVPEPGPISGIVASGLGVIALLARRRTVVQRQGLV